MFYFDLFNSTGHDYVIYNNEIINTNKSMFNLRFNYDNYKFPELTEINLIIEKTVEGKNILNGKYKAVLNGNEVQFKNIEFKNILEEDEKYILYFEYKQGGITIYSTKDEPINFIVSTIPTYMEIEISDSIKLEGVYELQGSQISFQVKTRKNKTLFYDYKISKNEEENVSEYKNFVENEFSEPLVATMLKDNITFLHFWLKDQFGNVNYKKYKLTTKENSFVNMLLLDKEIAVKSLDEEFSIFFEQRNVTSITPTIRFSNNDRVEELKLSQTTLTGNKHTLRLSDFGSVNAKSFMFFFILNNDPKLTSNQIYLGLDDIKPEIKIEPYTLITEKYINKHSVTGKIIDDNYFYLGKLNVIKESKTLTFIQNDNSLFHITNPEKIPLNKYTNFYYCDNDVRDIQVIGENGNTDVATKLFSKNERSLYVWLDFDSLTIYEQNLIKNQGTLSFKGDIDSNIIEQKSYTFDNIIILEAILGTEKNLTSFDVGIIGHEYSFLYHVNKNNISAEINLKKQVNTDFDKSEFFILKDEKTELIKFNNKKVLSEKKGVFNGKINFLAVSYKDEKIGFKNNLVFFNNVKTAVEEIYYLPELIKESKKINYLQYKCKQISNKIYEFECDIEIEEGNNRYQLIFEDSLENKIEKEFEIEKNIYPIEAVPFSREKKLNIFKNEIIEITSREEIINISFNILNETKKMKEETQKIIVKGTDIVKNFSLSKTDVERNVTFNFTCGEQPSYFEVYYEGIIGPICKFTIQKKNFLYLNVSDKLVTGLTTMILPVEKDNFSKLSVNYTNPLFDIKPVSNGIEFTRISAVKSIDNFKIEVNVFDENNLFEAVSKIVDCTFFNDNIIDKYEIQNIKDNKIKTNTFDLKFVLNDYESLEYFRINDPFELNFRKRFKYGVLGNEVLIEGITTPINDSSFFVEFKIKNSDIIVKKEIFKENPIKLYDESKEFSSSISKQEQYIDINVKSVNPNHTIKISSETGVLLEEKLTVQNYIKRLDAGDIAGQQFISIEIKNNLNKTVYFNKKMLDFEIIENKAILGLKFKEVIDRNKLQSVKASGLNGSLNYYIVSTDVLNHKKIININEGYNDLSELGIDLGIKHIEFYSARSNKNKKLISSHMLEIIESMSDRINYTKTYQNFDMINSLVINSNVNMFNINELDGIVRHKTNQSINDLKPIYLNENLVQFDFNKRVGLNRFIYIDDFGEVELGSCTVIKPTTKTEINIKNINTDDESFYFFNNDRITLETLCNVSFVLENSDRILIKPKNLGSQLKRDVYENIPVIIYKEFIPCYIDLYKDDKVLKTIEIIHSKRNNVDIKLEDEQKEIVEYNNFKIRNLNYFKENYNFTIRHKPRHFLLSYTLHLAKVLEVNIFLTELNIDEQEEIIKDISANVFEEYKVMNVDLIKERIKKELMEKWKRK